MFVRIGVLLLCAGLASCQSGLLISEGVVPALGIAKDFSSLPHDPGEAPITPPEEGSSSGNTGGPWDEGKTKKP